MLNENLKNKLLETFNEGNYNSLNVSGLLDLMSNSNVNYYMADLNGPMGMATIEGVYIDINRILAIHSVPFGFHTTLLYFIILHETAHMKRILKMGKEQVLKNLSLNDFNDFFEHVVNEELIADTYGSLVFYMLNKKEYPSYYTQNLRDSNYKEKYKNTARGFFGQIQNDEASYTKFVNKFIKKIY